MKRKTEDGPFLPITDAWHFMCAIEPSLYGVLKELNSVEIVGSATEFWRRFNEIWAKCKSLVGHDAGIPALRTTEAYDVAFAYLWNVYTSKREA